MQVLGISGSLRRGSYNTALLKVAAGLAPEGMRIEIADISGIPIFNADQMESEPEAVRSFKERIAKADALLIATPEYNYSIPGVLKNAIDWASKPGDTSPLVGKPVAIMSASTGMIGGERAQLHLRQIFIALDMRAVNRPEVIVTFAAQKIDAEGNLSDQHAKELIAELLKALARLVGPEQK